MKFEKHIQNITGKVISLTPHISERSLNGKSGIAILLYCLSKQNGHEYLASYADELLNDITDNLSGLNESFVNGLLGIGWTIEVIADMGFINVDTNEVLEELDKVAFLRCSFFNANEACFLDGILGTGFYMLKRIKNEKVTDENLSVLLCRFQSIRILDELDRRFVNIDGIDYNILLFDMLWDIPLIVWYLSELYALNLYNSKCSKVIKKVLRCIEAMGELKVKSNGLTLALSLQYLQSRTGSDCSKLIKGFLQVSKEEIEFELNQEDFSFRYGMLGISWLFLRLFRVYKRKIFLVESQYWEEKAIKVYKSNEKFSDITVLTGISGWLFLLLESDIDM